MNRDIWIGPGKIMFCDDDWKVGHDNPIDFTEFIEKAAKPYTVLWTGLSAQKIQQKLKCGYI